MPKRIEDIFNFEKGIFGNTSTGNVPEGHCTYSENLDSKAIGRLRSVDGATTLDSSFNARIISYDNVGNEEEIIGQNSSKQVRKYDINAGTSSNIGSPTDDFIASMAPQNEELYCGTCTTFRGDTPSDPVWVGYINHGQIWSGGSVGDQVVSDAECKSFASSQDFTSSTTPLFDLEIFNQSGSEDVFSAGNRYFYAISLVYDGYQESPLIKDRTDDSGTFEIDIASATSALDLVIKVGHVTDGDIPRRITNINIYRASNTTQDPEPTSAYRLVKSLPVTNTNLEEEFLDTGIETTEVLSGGEIEVDVNDASNLYLGGTIQLDGSEYSISYINSNTVGVSPNFNAHSNNTPVLQQFNDWNQSDTGAPGSYSGDAWFIRIRDQGNSGPSFEDNTGFPDTIETNSVKYKLAAEQNNQLFVGLCDLDEVEQDVKNYIFVSGVGRFSIFNWAEDFIRLPEPPRGLMGFSNRLYAFSGSDTYVINPNPRVLSIEKKYDGGVINEFCVTKSSFGMFYASKNNIYWDKGNGPTPIGTSILEFESSEAGSVGWQQIIHTDAANNLYPFLVFDPIHKRLLAFAATGTNTHAVYAYDVERDRWDFYPNYLGGYNGAVGEDGTVYVTDGNGTPELSSIYGGSKLQWKLETPKYSPSGDSRYSYFYEAAARATGSPTIKYSVDGGAYQNPGTSDEDGLRKAKVSTSDKKAHTASLLVESAAATDEVDALTLQFRQAVHSE